MYMVTSRNHKIQRPSFTPIWPGFYILTIEEHKSLTTKWKWLQMRISESDLLWSVTHAISCIGFRCEIQAHMFRDGLVTCPWRNSVPRTVTAVASSKWTWHSAFKEGKKIPSLPSLRTWCKILRLNSEFSFAYQFPLSEIKLQWGQQPHLQDIWHLKLQQASPRSTHIQEESLEETGKTNTLRFKDNINENEY